MSYRLKIDQAVNCVFVQHFGVIEKTEIDAQMHLLIDDPSYIENMSLLRDVSLTTLPDDDNLARIKRTVVSTSMMAVDEILGRRRKVAWVLSNASDFKVIHQWSVSARLNRLVADRQPFRDVNRAMKWLGIPDDYKIDYPD